MNVASCRWLLVVVLQIIYFVDANWITGNLCWSMPCMNGGSCYGSAYTYLCVCPINYSGALCEKRLGICQESPCGNRGLCVETGLTSFECRCYFDYMGPLCEEHVPKNDPSVWSSLIPVHTRVLFDILQEAYRAKAPRRSSNGTDSSQFDFIGPLPTEHPLTSTSTTLRSTSERETTDVEHVIQADGIQLEKIFPEISTSDPYTHDVTGETSQPLETSQSDQDSNETISSTDSESQMTTTSVVDTIEHTGTLSTDVNMTTASFEEDPTSSTLNTTEDQRSSETTEPDNAMSSTSTSIDFSGYNSENDTTTSSTDIHRDSTEQVENYDENTDSEDELLNTSTNATEYSSIQTDEHQFNSSEERTTSMTTDPSLTTEDVMNTLNISQAVHSQLLVKLCQQLLSHILPNVSSSSAVEAALSLTSGSSATSNSSTSALLNWIKDQLTSSTTTTTVVSSSSSTPLPSLVIGGKKLFSIPLQRVDMDEALHQMNNNIDGEH